MGAVGLIQGTQVVVDWKFPRATPSKREGGNVYAWNTDGEAYTTQAGYAIQQNLYGAFSSK